jgi:myo-inositol-1-phosphate synthase
LLHLVDSVASQGASTSPAVSHQAGKMLVENFVVQSPNVAYSEEHITSTYNYDSTKLSRDEKGQWIVTPTSTEYQFRVDRRVPKLG